MNEHICPICIKVMTTAEIEEAIEANTSVEKKLAHPNCYYEELGDEVEKKPIYNPSRVKPIG